MINPARDAEFEGLQLRPGMRQLLQANPPRPQNDRNVEFCVSWWGCGGCYYSNCNRVAAHCAFANVDERARLLAHVRTQHLTATPGTAAAPAASRGT